MPVLMIRTISSILGLNIPEKIRTLENNQIVTIKKKPKK
jgi:hypothetical protein